MTSTDNTLLITLAKLLTCKQVSTENISDSLRLICDTFAFDCGLIYEIDQDNFFNLKESYSSTPTSLNENFSITEIDPKLRYHLAQEIITYVPASTSTFESELLKLFSAKALVLVSIIDETSRICGFLLFSTLSSKNPLNEHTLEDLSVTLPLLSKYISIRVYQNKLSFAKNSLQGILDNAGIDIYVNDFNTHDILYVNKSMAAPYGGPAKFYGRKCWEVLFPEQMGPCSFCPQQHLIDEYGNPTKVYTWDYQRAFDGSWFRVFSASFRWVDGRLAHVVSSADITDNKRNEELIQYLANYDSLTKLPNRRMLVAECEQRINKAQPGETGYVLFFDIDGFKNINDSLGHDAGDEFLIKLGEFFSGIPLLKDAIYRNGGDEFVAIIDGKVNEDSILNLAEFIHSRFSKPWQLKKGSISCNVSIGIACYPEDGITAEDLLQQADRAMYYAKKSGGARICFHRELKK